MEQFATTRRGFLKSVGAMAAAAAWPGLLAAGSPRRKPNFVLIFIDDMGYGDIGPFGSTKNRTPNLDRMAAEGMKLTSFYVAAPVCTPSRAALMTGCYPKRVGLAKGPRHAVLLPGDAHGLNADEVTVAEVLKSAGYATACIGKWHLGDQPEFLPTRHGFDYYFGLPYSNDMWAGHPVKKFNFPPLPLMRGEKAVGRIDTMADQSKLTALYTQEAVTFIRDNKDRPFFLYLPHNMMHGPLAPGAAFAGKSANGKVGDVIEELDWSTGEILKTIRELGIEKDTLVFFTSDNGAAAGTAAPLRGRKGTCFEGGMREPTLAWWPGTIPAGAVCDEIATAMDILPTFAALAGAKQPQDRIIDGKGARDLLTGKGGAKSKYEAFFYYRRESLSAVRSGPWKLHANGQLYNLDKDIGEKTNVADDNPAVVKRLAGYLEKARADLGDGPDPGPGCRPVGKAKGPLKYVIPRSENTNDNELHK